MRVHVCSSLAVDFENAQSDVNQQTTVARNHRHTLHNGDGSKRSMSAPAWRSLFGNTQSDIYQQAALEASLGDNTYRTVAPARCLRCQTIRYGSNAVSKLLTAGT
eukprot:scpid82243/ scgid8739/ 